MANKKSVGHAYNVDFLNVVFAASSLFLFFTTIWMVFDDFDREWKGYQRQFVLLDGYVTSLSLQAAQAGIDQERLQQLNAERAAAEQVLAANGERVAVLESELADVEADFYLANQQYNFLKADYDVERYAYEELREEHPEEAAEVRPEVDDMYDRWVELGMRVEELVARRDGLRAQIGEYTGGVADADAEIRELTAEATRLAALVEDLQVDFVGDVLLNAPLLDFMAPSLTVQQTITPNIHDELNFIRFQKMDRCRTCHIAIDREGYETYPQPYTTHPSLETYVGSASPHPLATTGCTVCHEGMGQSIGFVSSSHTPETDEQMHAWEEQYGWEVPHLWDYPMLPADMTEASCAKCHTETVYVDEAEDLNLAYGLYERAGCYACHTTTGFTDLRKPGPNLTKIASKLSPEWVSSWIRDPREVKPSTWMPRIWYNSNTSSPEDAVRNEVEIDAAVAYLFANSEEHDFAVLFPPRGNAERGQELVESVGCLACHITEDQNRLAAGTRRTFGQPLQNIGNKTSYEWLFDWVRDPKHFSSETYMPDLRLTNREAADIATYLTTLTGPEGRGAEATYDDAEITAVLLDYVRSILPTAEAEELVGGMSLNEQRLDLGQRVVGRYGCFSCHEIAGFEDARPIGIELSEEGSKLLSRLDFAFVHDIPHSKVEWFKQKMRDPRAFDRNRVLQPLEKLRMPNFGMSDEEAKLFATAIMSFQSDVQPLAAKAPRSARNDALREGRNLVRRRNCVGCHEIEEDGGDYVALVDDPSLAPPMLTPEGAKVQPDWLYAFLQGPIPIRPWLDVRMPTFGLDDAHWNGVIDYFGAISDTVGEFRTHDTLSAAAVPREAEELFDLLRCQQCHVLDTIPADQPTDNLAPDLRMARERLQPDWIVDWLRAPLEIQPGTRMPMFWADFPASPYPQLDSDGPRQLEAIRDYLLTFEGGPSPNRGN
jgi:mono/diheme cytochrome c family protein